MGVLGNGARFPHELVLDDLLSPRAMMQTMNSQRSQTPSLAIRLVLLLLCAISGGGAVLSLMGYAPLGFFYLVPFAMIFLLLRMPDLQERAKAKKKAPGRSSRPGAKK